MREPEPFLGILRVEWTSWAGKALGVKYGTLRGGLLWLLLTMVI